MKIGKLGFGDENPFLKGLNKNDELNKNNPLNNSQDLKVGDKNNADKIKETDKPGMKEGAASNASVAPAEKLDKKHFTNENDIQEIDLQEFEDDFR